MGILKKLDLFKSVNAEHKEGTVLGTILTFLSLIIIFYFFSKEISEYKHQKLISNLYVNGENKSDLIYVMFDIEFFKIKCETLRVNLQKSWGEVNQKKKNLGEGCRINGNFEVDSQQNDLSFTTDLSTTIMDLLTASLQSVDGVIVSNHKTIDFSHKIYKFQFGKSVRRLKALENIYPDMIKANPLNNEEYVSKNESDGHSLFLYELNIVNSRINGKKEIIYNYNKNTINSMTTNAYLKFDFNFSPIAVEYEEGNENFFEFLTYLMGLIGGILSSIKIVNNIIVSCFFKSEKGELIPTSEQ
jgi:hypothetical protein